MNKKQMYKFGVDWLNGILPITDVQSFFKFISRLSPKLGLSNWELQKTGMYNYNTRFCFNGKKTFQVMYNQDTSFYTAQEQIAGGNNYGLFLTLSGDGIRELQSIHPMIIPKLFMYLHKFKFKATRFDVYCDIFDKDNKAISSIAEAFEYFYLPRCGYKTLKTDFHRSLKIENAHVLSHIDFNGENYDNYQLGNHGSRAGMFRAYNKLDETYKKHSVEEFAQIVQNYGVLSDYWYRMEYELHGDKAIMAFAYCLNTYKERNQSFDFGGLWLECCKMFFSVVQCTNKCTIIKKLNNADEWDSFLNDIMHIIDFVELGKPFKPVPFVERGIAHSSEYLKRSAAYVFFILRLYEEDPELQKYVLTVGKEKFDKSFRYKKRREQLHRYDVSPHF